MCDFTEGVDYLQDCTIPGGTSHGGSDVAIYSRGPLAHLFTGSHEQHYIPKVLLYAACVGPDKRHCDDVSNSGDPINFTISTFIVALLLVLFH